MVPVMKLLKPVRSKRLRFFTYKTRKDLLCNPFLTRFWRNDFDISPGAKMRRCLFGWHGLTPYAQRG